MTYIEPFDSYVGCEDYENKRAKKIVKNNRILSQKYEYLIHLIISRMVDNQGYALLSSTVLEKVFGKVYKDMLRNLISMNIIYKDGYFILGEKSYGYILFDNVRFSSSQIPLTEYYGYRQKLKEALKPHQKQVRKEIVKKINDDDFLENYESSLNQVSIPFYAEAMRYISLHHFQSDYAKQCYIRSVERFKEGDLKIYSYDKNKRIYTPLTSMPKILKSFLNLKFSLDIHNSHPLLFNHLLYKSLKLPSILFQEVSLLLVNFYNKEAIPNNLHNVRRFLRKYLINNGINKEEIKDIPIDVLEYIYLTSNGIFWDEVLREVKNTELLRSDVKVMMFAEVFYSKKLSTRGKENAKAFRKRFPNVYHAVLSSKKNDRTGLANYMMALESKIFWEILKRLYAAGYKVVNIHDAIVVPDTPENEGCTVEIVSQIMAEVYRDYSLTPNVSIDYYGEKYMKKVLGDEEILNGKIDEYMAALQLKDDEESKEILTQIHNGKLEFVLGEKQTLVPHMLR